MPKLNQIIAVVNGKKTQTQRELTDLHKLCQKSELFTGIIRNYKPLEEDGETLPPEHKKLQNRTEDILHQISSVLADMFDVVMTQDIANTKAKANVIVDDIALLLNVPVTHLLFLEKQLTDIHTFVTKLPVIDADQDWEWNENRKCFVTEPVRTSRTKKIPRNHVKYEATKEHPAQVEMYTEDVKVGEWETVRLSGGVSEGFKDTILGRIHRLQKAVQFAREEANGMEVTEYNEGKVIFDYLFLKE